MRGHLDRFTRSSAIQASALALVLLVAPPTRARAQMFGSGYGMGYPGYGYGMGYPGYGVGGLGYGFGYGYGGGFGFPGYGYGGGFAYGGAAPFIGGPGPYGYPVPFGGTGPGVLNPYFGVGLTPLGVNSALTERYLLGRGTTTARPSGVAGTTTAPITPSGYAAPTILIPRP